VDWRCKHHERQSVSPGQQSWRGLGRTTDKAVWHIVREYATVAGIAPLARHDLRRSCARLCHAAGGQLDQIQFLLGHVSIQTTERLNATSAAGSGPERPSTTRIGIEPAG
jgi:site-specific recombinase XerD